jgi:hypothetical protein
MLVIACAEDFVDLTQFHLKRATARLPGCGGSGKCLRIPKE